jgi:hypothetical protein
LRPCYARQFLPQLATRLLTYRACS